MGFKHPKARVRRLRTPAFRVLGALPLVAALGTLLTFSTGFPTSATDVLFRALLVLVGLMSAANLPPREESVRIDAEGLHVGRKLAVRHEDIRAVRVTAHDRAGSVFIVPRQGATYELMLARSYDAADVLAALGRSALTTVRFEVERKWLRFGVTAAALAAILFTSWGLAGALVGVLLAQLMMPKAAAVEVGGDGIVDFSLWRRRFIPFVDVAYVFARDDGAVVITLRSGSMITLNMGSSERAVLLAKRIERGLRSSEDEIAEDAAKHLLQDARRLAERLPDLRRLGAPEHVGSYREAAPSREHLWRIVEDSTLEPKLRVGAAVALSGELADTDRTRLRIAAEATASPKTRIALERVAAEASDDERLVEALDDLEVSENREVSDDRAGADKP